MKTMLIMPLLLMNPFVQSTAHASEPGCAMHFPKVSTDLAQFDATLIWMRSEQDSAPADPIDVEWVKNKLQFMFEIDQYLRNFVQSTQGRSRIVNICRIQNTSRRILPMTTIGLKDLLADELLPVAFSES